MFIRYYVCREGHLRWRLPDRIHSQLLEGELCLPEFAGRTIDILEVISDKTMLLDARGTRGHFDNSGRLDTLRRSAAVVGDVIESGQGISKKVVDLQPRIRRRRRQIEDLWKPDETLQGEVRAELAAGKRSKLPIFPRSK